MKRIALLTLLVASVFLAGCGTLLPKKVELFQDKVKKYPEVTQAQKELEREAAQRAKEKAAETLNAALAEKASPFVVAPAKETAVLTDVVSTAVGAPASRPTIDTVALADEVRRSIAKQTKRIDNFVEDSNENVGKKIEGTGLVQVPYLAWLGGFVVLLLVVWNLIKVALTAASAANPGAMLGVGAMNVAGSTISKGFTQLVQGGEKFVDWVNTTVEDPVLKQKIVDAFTNAHKKSQDADVKAVVNSLLK